MSKISPLKSIQKEIWQECRRIKKVKEATNCYICDADLTKKKSKQLGHLIPKVFLPTKLKYDLRLLKPCCYFCNMNCGGNSFLFGRYLEEEYGQEYIQDIIKDFDEHKYVLPKLTDKEKLIYYQELLEEYKLL